MNVLRLRSYAAADAFGGAAGATRRPAVARPRVVLGWIVLIVLIALGMHAASPWLLPVKIHEGPMVQMASETGASLVWYTTRDAECSVIVNIDGARREFRSADRGTRHLVRIDGLEPGLTFPYEIRSGGRPLTAGLAFQTNRTADQPYSFIVFGDSGRATKAQYSVAAEMTRAQPPADFLVHTGDLVYSDGLRKRYRDRFFAPYRHLLARVNFWPCLGNHDLDVKDAEKARTVQERAAAAAAYQEVFELPQNGPPGLPSDFNYWFDYASCRIAVVDTNTDEQELQNVTAPWLRDVMSAPGPRWKFVVFHHPPYSGGKYRDLMFVRRPLVPVLEETGVDLVFTGHEHNYQRTHAVRGGQVVPAGEGVTYVVSGAGGARLYEINKDKPEYVACYDDDQYGYTQVTVEGDRLTLQHRVLNRAQALDTLLLDKAALARRADPAAAPTLSHAP